MRRLLIDGNAMAENLRVIRTAAGNAAIYGVLKADGYGLGLAPTARILARQGIDRFAVTEPSAAAALAGMGLNEREILLLRPVTEAEAEMLLRKPVMFSIGSPEEAVVLARAAIRMGVRPRVQVQIDTGLGRYGFPWDEPGRLRFLYESFTVLRFTGIYTHFASPCRALAVRRQFERFRTVLVALEEAGIDPGIRHCCESSALLRYPDMALDAVRVGSGLLGRVPGAESFGLQDVCRCEATLETVRTLRPGDTVGYGSRYRARREMRVAVADIGFLHGLGAATEGGRKRPLLRLCDWLHQGLTLLRGASLCAETDGRRIPVLGRLCSECCVLDVTDMNGEPGDMVAFPINPMFARNMERVWLDGVSDEDMRPVA